MNDEHDAAFKRIKSEMLARIEPVITDAAREIAQRLIGGDMIYMTCAEYGRHVRPSKPVSEKTVRKWVKAGLPHKYSGKLLFVKVAEADAWNERDATRRSAELAANGAKR